MIDWEDISEDETRFYYAEVPPGGASVASLVTSLREFAFAQLIRSAEDIEDKALFFEVNADSGRMVMALGSEEGRSSGSLDGCCVRSLELQDQWYDIFEKGLSDDVFVAEVRAMVMALIEQVKTELMGADGSRPATLVAYGSNPGEELVRYSMY